VDAARSRRGRKLARRFRNQDTRAQLESRDETCSESGVLLDGRKSARGSWDWKLAILLIGGRMNVELLGVSRISRWGGWLFLAR
jgi:hypothetical protein